MIDTAGRVAILTIFVSVFEMAKVGGVVTVAIAGHPPEEVRQFLQESFLIKTTDLKDGGQSGQKTFTVTSGDVSEPLPWQVQVLLDP